jgi:tetratricopeptide (TPR) repeat protein
VKIISNYKNYWRNYGMTLLSKKNIRYVIAYILLLSLPLVLMPEPIYLAAQQVEEGEKLLEEGIYAVKQGAYDVAIVRLEGALSKLEDKEKKADALFYLSISYFALKQIEKVKELLTEMFKLKPKIEPDLELSPQEFITLWEEVKKENLASLSIETNPDKVDIYLDGERIGKSPLKLKDLLSGEYNVRLEKDGYQSMEKFVTLVAGKENKLSFKLEKEAVKKVPQVAVTPPEKKPEVKKGKGWLWILLGGVVATAAAVLFTRGGEKTAATSTPTTINTTTTTIPSGSNQQPKMVELQGPTSCEWGDTVEYKAKGADPDGNRVSINFWIKDTSSDKEWEIGWSNFVNNNEWIKKSVTWDKNKYSCGSSKCQYRIRAKCKDESGRESDPLRLDVKVNPSYDFYDDFLNFNSSNWIVMQEETGFYNVSGGRINLNTGYHGACTLIAKRGYRLTNEILTMIVKVRSNFNTIWGNEFAIGFRNQWNKHYHMIELNRLHDPYYGPNLANFNQYKLVTRLIDTWYYTNPITANFTDFVEIKFECTSSEVKIYVDAIYKISSVSNITKELIYPCFRASNADQYGEKSMDIDWVKVSADIN